MEASTKPTKKDLRPKGKQRISQIRRNKYSAHDTHRMSQQIADRITARYFMHHPVCRQTTKPPKPQNLTDDHAREGKNLPIVQPHTHKRFSCLVLWKIVSGKVVRAFFCRKLRVSRQRGKRRRMTTSATNHFWLHDQLISIDSTSECIRRNSIIVAGSSRWGGQRFGIDGSIDRS